MPAPAATHPLTDPQQASDLLLYRLAKLTAVSARLVTRLCEGQYGITRREWGVLMWLAQQPGLPPSALAERLELDRARTSRAIASLLAKGLVQRHAQPGNRRQAVLQLTEAGQQLHQTLFPQIREINLRMLAPLAPADAAQLDATLAQLQQQAEHWLQQPAEPRVYPPRSARPNYQNKSSSRSP
ncbi:hypothetical protein GCM10027082_03980 [Comamonas humi]